MDRNEENTSKAQAEEDDLKCGWRLSAAASSESQVTWIVEL